MSTTDGWLKLNFASCVIRFVLREIGLKIDAVANEYVVHLSSTAVILVLLCYILYTKALRTCEAKYDLNVSFDGIELMKQRRLCFV